MQCQRVLIWRESGFGTRGGSRIQHVLSHVRTNTVQATAAAIDRVVHHSVILELNIPSYRMEQANNIKHADDKGNTDAGNERIEK